MMMVQTREVCQARTPGNNKIFLGIIKRTEYSCYARPEKNGSVT